MTEQLSAGDRAELALAVVFSGAWAAAILVMIGVLPLAGTFDLDLYYLFSFASALGWLAGNVYLNRVRRGGSRRRLAVLYLCGPSSLLYLARALASREIQAAAPLVPLLSFAVFSVFFAVPITFAGGRKRK